MSADHIYYKCPSCQKQYDLITLVSLLYDCQMTQNATDTGSQVAGKCDCGVEAIFIIKSEYSNEIDAAIQTLFDAEEMAELPEPTNDEYDWPEESYYDFPTEPQGSTDNLQQVPKTDTQNKIEAFKQTIQAIDKNLDEAARAPLMKTLKTNILNIHITNMENCHRVFPPYTDDNNEFINKSDAQIAQDNIPLRDFLEKSYGETFISNASKLFKSRLDKELNQRIFETTLNKYLIEFRFNCYMEDTLSIYEDDWSPERRKALYRNILQKTCSDIYLDHYRTELSGWINHIEKGKALFIDCLMGVGKTYSIVKTLATKHSIP